MEVTNKKHKQCNTHLEHMTHLFWLMVGFSFAVFLRYQRVYE